MSLNVSLPLFVALLCSALATRAAAQPGRGPAPVVVARVSEQTVTATQKFVGSVMPVQHAVIGSAVDGRVIEVPIEEGDRVASGQKLAQLLTETISLELASAIGELEFRKQQVAELENGTRPEEIEQRRARMAAAQARYDYLEARRKRLKNLYEKRNAVTEEEYEEAHASAEEARETYLEAKAAHELAVAGPREELIAQAKAQVVMQQAVVDRLRDRIKKHTIKSRFDGYVIEQTAEVGEWVNSGDPVAEVVGVDEVEVVAQVVEQNVAYVVPGSEVDVEIPAVPDRKFTGAIITTVPQADMRARTFPVKVLIKNEISAAGPLLKPGMLARVALPAGKQQTALLVPKDAIVLGQAQPMVYAVVGANEKNDEGSAAPIPVSLGVSKGPLIQVQGDLKPGQLVVVEGNERLQPGQPVQVADILDAERQAQKTGATGG